MQFSKITRNVGDYGYVQQGGVFNDSQSLVPLIQQPNNPLPKVLFAGLRSLQSVDQLVELSLPVGDEKENFAGTAEDVDELLVILRYDVVDPGMSALDEPGNERRKYHLNKWMKSELDELFFDFKTCI